MKGTIIFLLLSLFAMNGCNTMDISSDYDSSMDFSKLRTFTWAPMPPDLPNDPFINKTQLDSQIREATENQLAALGFVKETAGNPDFLIVYHAAVEKGIDVVELNNYYANDPHNRYHMGWGSGHRKTYVFEYDLGTLILDFLDPEMKKIIWRGSVQAEVNRGALPIERETRIDEAIQKMLGEFPRN